MSDAPGVSVDVVASNAQPRCEQLTANAALGAVVPVALGTKTFFENSEVLPAGFVAVAVTALPRPAAGTNTRALPEPSATADARYWLPHPKAPGARSLTNSSPPPDAQG